MRNRLLLATWFFVMFASAVTAEEKPTREIFVPETELAAVFEAAVDRVLMPRNEFETLLRRSREIRQEIGFETEAGVPPVGCVLLSGDYSIDIHDQRAEITGSLDVDVLIDGFVDMPLAFNRVSLLGATETKPDGTEQPAAIGSPKNETDKRLILDGKGRHKIELRMATPLEIDSTRQRLAFRVPQGASHSLGLSVPGDVELKSGASVLSRKVDGGRTRFELLLPSGATETELLMTLNSHRTGTYTAMLARSVQFAEVTEQYERLHATVSLHERHQGIREASFLVPPGFEMTDVRSLLLDRWNIRKTDGGPDVLEIRFREQRVGMTTLQLSAVKTETKINVAWQFPVFRPVEVASNSTVLGLLLDTDLEFSSVESRGLFPVNTMTLKDAIPATALDALPGSPSIRLALAWYRPMDDGTISVTFRRPEARCKIETRQTFTLSEDHPELEFQGTITPRTGRVFELVFETPDHWTLTAAMDKTGQPLEFRKKDDGKTAIRLPRGIPPGEMFEFRCKLVGSVPGWFDDVPEKTLRYPVVRLEGTAVETGTVFIRTKMEDDWEVQPTTAENLSVLDENQLRAEAPGMDAVLALRYTEAPFSLELGLKKLEPRLTARSFSFYRFEPKRLRVRHEVEYDVEQARTRSLAFEMHGDTPTTPDIRGLDGLEIKETFSEDEERSDVDDVAPIRIWTVKLAKPVSGKLRLAVEFEMPIDDALYEKPDAGMLLYGLRTTGTVWQSTVAAIEGDEELDIAMPPETDEHIGIPLHRPADVGVLGPSEYKPGNRLLGVFMTYDSEFAVEIRKNLIVEPVTALVRHVHVSARLEPVTNTSQTATLYSVRYEIQTAGGSVRVRIEPTDEIWSVALDGEAVKPQRVGDEILIPISPRPDISVRNLTLLYRSSATVAKRNLSFPALKLAGKTEPIPVMQTTWNVQPPPGYDVVRLGQTDVRPSKPEPALFGLFRYGADFFSALIWRPQLPGIGCSGGPKLGISSVATLPSPYYMNNRVEYLGGVSQDSVSVGEEWSYSPWESSKMSGQPRDRSSNAGKPASWPAMDETVSSIKSEEGKAEDPFNRAKTGESLQRGMQRGRRLQSVQPVTVALAFDSASEHSGDLSVVGDRNMRNPAVTLADRDTNRRWGVLGCLVTVLIAMAGLGWTRQRKAAFVFGFMLLGTVAVFLGGPAAVAVFFNGVVYGAALGGLIFTAEALRRKVFVRKEPVDDKIVHNSTATVVVLFTAVCFAASSVNAEDELPKITLPGDAIIVPYSPGSVAEDRLPDVRTLIRPGQAILVPMKRHRDMLRTVELYEKALGKTVTAALTHAVSSALYEMTIDETADPEVAGKIRIDVFTDRPVLVPVTVEGGVLTNPRLDGKPARLQSQSASLSMLLVEGMGPHELTFTVKLRVQRQGGWRITAGKLPVATGMTVRLKFPETIDDLLTGNALDKRKWELDKNRVVETAPAPDGSFRWQWRSAVSKVGVDRNLEVESAVRLDVQEDGLWVRWTPTFRISRGRWEMLRLNLPNDYVIVEISGENVRGWTIAPETPEGITAVDVELLKPAENRETLIVRLHKAETQKKDGVWRWPLPRLSITEAGIHRGRIDLYRSSGRGLQVADLRGLSPTDMPTSNPAETLADGASPLGMQAFQSYRFAAESHGMTVLARSVTEKRAVENQTLLKITRSDVLVESKLRFSGSEKPFCAAVRLPEGFTLNDVETPSGVFWNRETVGGDREIVNLSCGDGFPDGFAVLIDGRLFDGRLDGAGAMVLETLPRFDVDFEGADETHIERKTSIAVLTEPSLDVRAENLEHCRASAPDRVFSWLQRPEQRELVRLALDGGKDFTARLVLTQRKPEIRCSTITNIRTTAEAVEETTLLDFTITRAGTRTLEFLLPARPGDVRIEAPMLRRKTIEPYENEGVPASMRVTLELQDEIIGQYRVLARTDRRLRPETDYDVIAPIIPADPGARQYVVMENDRRSPDEMVVDPARLENLRPLSRQQNEWRYLASMLGGNVTEAYCRSGGVDTAAAHLRFKMRRRETVRLAEARIDLAETRLVLGENGCYRAEQIYRIDNKKEPYLDLLLPGGASLWSVRMLDSAEWQRKQQGDRSEPGRSVLCRSVKACTMPADVVAGYPAAKGKAETRLVRIPLVKTESGDLDYVVRLVYAGTVSISGATMRSLNRFELPFITVLNVPVGQSLVRLHLPDGYEYRFDGNLQPIETYREHEVVQQAETNYRRQQDDRLRQVLSSDNPYAVGRAKFNLGQKLSNISKVDTFHYVGEEESTKDGGGTLSLKSKSSRIDYPDAEVPEPEPTFIGNTVTIEKQFQSQMNKRSNDAVGQKGLSLNSSGLNGGNVPMNGATLNGNNAGFDQGWLDQSNLSNSFTVNDVVPQRQGTPPTPHDGQVGNAPNIVHRDRFGRPGQAAQLGFPMEPMQQPMPQSQVEPVPQQSRAVEVRDRNIVLGNRQRQSDTLASRTDNLDRQVGFGYGGGTIRGEGTLSGKSDNREGRRSGHQDVKAEGFIQLHPQSSDVSTLPQAPAAPAPMSEPKPAEEVATGSGGTVYMGGTVVGGKAVDKVTVGLTVPEPERAPSGLSTRSASLDIEIPESGKPYLFTTPQGALELAVRPVSSQLPLESLRLGAALFGLALIYGVYRLCLAIGNRWTFDRRTHRNLAGLVTLLGCLSLLLAPMVFLLTMAVAGTLWTTLLKRQKT